MLPDEGAACYRIDYSEIRGWCEAALYFIESKTVSGQADGSAAMPWAQGYGVTPSVETNGYWHTCRSMIFPTQTSSSSSEWSSAGEAEAGSAGEQPAKE